MRSTLPRLPVIEIFGPVLQGEGAMIDRQTHFVRLGGCDFRCSWCDSMFAVLPEEVRAYSVRMSNSEILDKLRNLAAHTPWVTLSGGNPALHDLSALVDVLHEAGFQIAVETQGTRFKSWLERCDMVTISPKPPSSGMDQDPDTVERFVRLPGANLKVIVFDEADYAYARDVHRAFPGVPLYLQVGNDLAEDSRDSLLAKLDWLANRTMSDPCMSDAIVLPQLHVLMYGNRRGV